MNSDKVLKGMLLTEKANKQSAELGQYTFEVVKGLLLQAVFYRLFGEAFCPDPGCRLYNATTHEALLAAQTAPHAGLCPRHREWLRALEGAPERA